jgi:Spy/CpxP family protein refolding chaperone
MLLGTQERKNQVRLGEDLTRAYALAAQDSRASSKYPSKSHTEEEHRMMNELVYGYLLARRTLVLAGVLAVACCALWAQNASPPTGLAGQRGPNQERQLQQLTQVLSLTADQQAQVKTLLAEQREKMEALRKSGAGSDASSQGAQPSREQMEAIRNDTDNKITALLNDDQKTKFAAWQQQRKERMERRQGANAPAPPGA